MKAWMCDGYKTNNFDSMEEAKKFAKNLCFLNGETYIVGKGDENYARYKIYAKEEYPYGGFYKVKIEKLEVE